MPNIAFLNEVIPDRKIIDLEHIRNEQEPQGTDNKKSIFDLYCKTDNGDSIVVELQKNCLNLPKNWGKLSKIIFSTVSFTASNTCSCLKTNQKNSRNQYGQDCSTPLNLPQ